MENKSKSFALVKNEIENEDIKWIDLTDMIEDYDEYINIYIFI